MPLPDADRPDSRRLQQAEADARAAAAEAVAALRRKETQVAAMLDGAFLFIALLTPAGLVLEFHQSALRFAPLGPDLVLGRPLWDTPAWTHDAPQRERLRAAIGVAASGQTEGFEATHMTRDGRPVTIDVTLRPAALGANPAAYVVAEGRDLTERTRAQSALLASRDTLASRVSVQAGQLAVANDSLVEMQALHAAVVQTIVDGVMVIDHRGRIEWTNDAALRMFGYAGGVVGENVRMLMPAQDAAHHDRYLSHYLATGERKIIGIGREVRGKRQDGSEFPMYLAVAEMQVDGVRKFTGIVRDLTEAKRLEHLLQERQTLARIGELAAVVAHEVRNPLAAIRGVVEVIRTRFPAGSADRTVLGDLLARVDSLDHLVSDLLVYGRPVQPVFRRVSILGVARDTAALVANDHDASAVRFDVSGDDAQLCLDPAQMGRALLNLITNAAQATRAGGVVRVTGARLAQRYRLTVADEGAGMAADVAARCLEPFFTTKTRGSGLGLPIAKRVIDEHRGGVEVTSVPGAGTRVVVDLPLDDASSVVD